MEFHFFALNTFGFPNNWWKKSEEKKKEKKFSHSSQLPKVDTFLYCETYSD